MKSSTIGKIYKLSNSVDDRYYIGSSTQRYLSNRLCTHRGDARNGRRPDNTLHIAMLEIGLENWKIEEIDSMEFTTTRDLRRLEDTHIDLQDKNCLNLKQAASLYLDEFDSKSEYQKAKYQVCKEKDKLRAKKRWARLKQEKLEAEMDAKLRDMKI